MAAAGVLPGRRRRRLGLVALLSLLGAAAGVWAWTTFVPPSATSSEVDLSEEEGAQDEIEEATGPVDLLNGRPRRRTRRPRSSQQTGEERRLSSFYAEQDKAEVAPQGTRAPPSLDAQGPLDLGGNGVLNPIGSAAVASKVESQAPKANEVRTTFLSADAIRNVVERRIPTLRVRLERLLQRDSSLAGKVTIIARVRPDGSIERVRVEPARYQGTSVAEVIGNDVRTWRFPAFKGSTHEITFPILLAAGGGR